MSARAKEPTTAALARLEELRAAVVAARERVGECEARARRANRDVDAAAQALRNFYSAVEDGAQQDADLEGRLRAELVSLRARMEARLVTQRGSSRMEYVDPEAEGRLLSAREAVEAAENSVVTFIREARSELEAEMVERSREARDELVEAFARVDQAVGRWRREANAWREQLLPHWGDVSPAEIPNLSPIPTLLSDASLKVQQALGGAIDRRGLYPMPASIAPGAEDEERHLSPLRGWEHRPLVVSSAAGLGD